MNLKPPGDGLVVETKSTKDSQIKDKQGVYLMSIRRISKIQSPAYLPGASGGCLSYAYYERRELIATI